MMNNYKLNFSVILINLSVNVYMPDIKSRIFKYFVALILFISYHLKYLEWLHFLTKIEFKVNLKHNEIKI